MTRSFFVNAINSTRVCIEYIYDELESGYEIFKIVFLLQEARLEKGLTKEELTEKVGAIKSVQLIR
jgi:hypothetical protein